MAQSRPPNTRHQGLHLQERGFKPGDFRAGDGVIWDKYARVVVEMLDLSIMAYGL